MKKNQTEIAASAAGSSPITETIDTNSLLTRREMLGITGMAGMAALTGIAPDAAAQTTQTPQKRPRIACLVSYWGLPTSHADWICNKLIDGYWWKGAHTPSQVDVVPFTSISSTPACWLRRSAKQKIFPSSKQ
jgi:hypothetical protein